MSAPVFALTRRFVLALSFLLLALCTAVPARAGYWTFSYISTGNVSTVTPNGTTSAAWVPNQPYYEGTFSSGIANGDAKPAVSGAGYLEEQGQIQPALVWQSQNGDSPPNGTVEVLLTPDASGAPGNGGPTPSDGNGDPDVTTTSGPYSGLVNCTGTVTKYVQVSSGTTSYSLGTFSLVASTTSNTIAAYVGVSASLNTAPDFSVTAGSNLVSTYTGCVTSNIVTLAPINGFSSNVTLGIVGLPSGVSADAGPNPVNLTLGVPATSTIYFLVTSSAASGSYPVTITASGGGVTHTVTFTLQILPPPKLLLPYAPPTAQPVDTVGDDPVDLATGDDTLEQAPDISVYNPSGMSVSFTRQWDSFLAQTGHASPGLSAGWTHNYDYTIQDPSVTWGPLTLVYPNGAQETITPTLNANGSPNGGFVTPTGAPYAVTGSPSSSVNGAWNWINVTWQNGLTYHFNFINGLVYQFTSITNMIGQSLNLSWNGQRDLTSVSDGTTGAQLLTLTYDGNGDLSTVTDCYGRQVNYGFNLIYYYFNGSLYSVTPTLKTVSQITITGAAVAPIRSSYGYNISGSNGFSLVPLLSGVSRPNPQQPNYGSNNVTDYINYDNQNRVSSVEDADEHVHSYAYGGSSTQVSVLPYPGAPTPTQTWTVDFDNLKRRTGTVDAAGNTDTVSYSGSSIWYPSAISDKNGNKTTFAYQQYSQLAQMLDPRGVLTEYFWDTADDPNLPLGEFGGVQVGYQQTTQRTARTLSYYSNGLLKTIMGPAPNSAPGGATVGVTFTYDTLGNVLAATLPANNASSSRQITYYYTNDPAWTAPSGAAFPAYSQPEALEEPLTITDEVGDVTHFRYNGRGLVSSVIDALGNETDYTYNLADQPLTVILPATGQTGSGRSTITYTYAYVGGPCVAQSVTDESGNVARSVSYNLGSENEILSVIGNVQPMYYSYDALYRLVGVSNGGSGAGSGSTPATSGANYYYNGVGELAGITYPDYTGPAWPNISGPDSVRFTFDKDGNPLTRIDGNGSTTTYTYNDPESFLTNIAYSPGSGVSALGSTGYTYDLYGRPATMTDATGSHSYQYDDADDLVADTTTYTGQSAVPVNYTYYPDGSRSAMSVAGNTFSYQYDAAGRPAVLVNPYNETSYWNYFANNWLETQMTASGNIGTSYNYNPLGEINKIYNEANGTATSVFDQITYNAVGQRTSATASQPDFTGQTTDTYNSLYQLSDEDNNRPNLAYNASISYDLAGDIEYGPPYNAPYNADDQLKGWPFDGNGNNTESYSLGTAQTYDPEDHLTSVSGSLACGYTGDGLRAWKQPAGGGRTYFYYDGAVPVLETNSSGTLQNLNTFGPNGLITRHNAATGSVFYTFDPQGSAAERLSGQGSVLTEQAISFPDHRVGTDQATDGLSYYQAQDPFSGYRGQWGYYLDDETLYELVTNRYYVPYQPQFLTRDPIGFAGGPNLYEYAADDPTNNADPSGLSPDADILPNFPGTLGMKSLHPGMMAGTAQSNTANQMLNGLLSTLGNAAFAAGTGGLGLLGEAGGFADEAAATDNAAEGAAAGPCFVAGTPVQMADGTTKPIQKVKVGDKVWSRNPFTGKTEAKRVVATKVHTTQALVALRLTVAHTGKVTETILCTPNHPFYVQGRGFTGAIRLSAGTKIVTRAGSALVVVSVRRENRTTQVYNFTVADDHTYFVGKANGGLWVHNDCTDDAIAELMNQGEGSIIRVQPSINPFGFRPPYLEGGNFWGYHDVFLGTDGNVFDPMRPFANGLPFNEWVQSWQNWQDYDFQYLSPEEFSSSIRQAMNW